MRAFFVIRRHIIVFYLPKIDMSIQWERVTRSTSFLHGKYKKDKTTANREDPQQEF